MLITYNEKIKKINECVRDTAVVIEFTIVPVINTKRRINRSPLLVINTRQIPVDDCIVRAEIQCTQISRYSSVTIDNSRIIITC